MKAYFKLKDEAVAYADGLAKTFPDVSVSITTITPEKFEVSCVPTAIDTSSEDIGLQTAKFFSDTQVNT